MNDEIKSMADIIENVRLVRTDRHNDEIEIADWWIDRDDAERIATLLYLDGFGYRER